MFKDLSFIVLAKEECPFCVKAKALLDLIGCSYEVIYKEPEDWPSYPAIYKVDGESGDLIGGFNELVTFYSHYE
jgi:hypothetical protein